MIDERVFKNVWALLCERFNREPSQMLMKAYYHALKDRLGNEDFKAAASRIFEGSDFFPKPADFMPTENDIGLDAVEQWDVALSALQGHRPFSDLDDRGRTAVRLLGGERKMRTVKLDEIAFVRRDFLKLYQDAAAIEERERRPELEAGEEAKRLAAGVELNTIEED